MLIETIDGLPLDMKLPPPEYIQSKILHASIKEEFENINKDFIQAHI
jgi:hypothetical protein